MPGAVISQIDALAPIITSTPPWETSSAPFLANTSPVPFGMNKRQARPGAAVPRVLLRQDLRDPQGVRPLCTPS